MFLAPIWLFARTFLNFGHFEGVRITPGPTRFANMQEPLTRIPNLVLTQKWRSMLKIGRTQQICQKKVFSAGLYSKGDHNSRVH